MDIIGIITSRIDALETNVLSEIKQNREGIERLRVSASNRKLECTKEFATRSYVKKVMLIIAVLFLFTVIEPDLAALIVKSLINIFT